MDANAFWLPAGIEPDGWIEARFGMPDQSRRLTVPDVTPRLLSQTAKALREARNVGLSQMPVTRIVEAIGAAVERWLDPTYHLRQMAEAYLPEITGYSQPMIRHGLPELLRPFQQKGLEALLHAASDDPLTRDHDLADGPRLTSIILAGNIPAVAVESIVHALLLKSSALVKGSSRDPLFPALFAQSIAEADADIGAALAVLWWKGGSPALDAAAIAPADAVVCYGDSQSIEGVKAHVSEGSTVMAYGPRISFGVIGREMLAPHSLGALADCAAWDVSFFDQQGCVSPHAIYVEEGGETTPAAFAARLALAMQAFDERYPRGKLSPSDAAAIQDLRGRWEARQAAGQPVALYASQGSTAWTVAFEAGPHKLTPGCLNRTVRVIGLDDLNLVPDLVSQLSEYLHTAGLTVGPERMPMLQAALEAVGVTRVCAIGRMQYPSAGSTG